MSAHSSADSASPLLASANTDHAAEYKRLSEAPDWRYLLRDYYDLYRDMSAGGSPIIRSHQRAVREAISKVLRADPPVQPLAPMQRPVTAHLRRALDNGRRGPMAAVIRAICIEEYPELAIRL